MCGIVGFLGNLGSADENISTVEHMANQIKHRGPDDAGAWTDVDAGITLSQRRLSIVDLSPAGHQPMFSSDQRYAIVFNGEIYNHRELRHKLEAEANQNWRGHSDTEVFLAAISQWGLEAALSSAVGMFAFGLWDRNARTLHLGRDRLGEKPLYYGRIGNTFAFASELAAFAALPGWAPVVNRNAIALLMRHNYIPTPYTIYANIEKLPPGHLAHISGTTWTCKSEPYWQAAQTFEGQNEAFVGTAEEAVDELEKLLKQSLRGQMVADVPVGAFLSGGIDSSVVVALMQTMASKPVKTFTIGFEQAGYNEAEHAKRVARHLQTDHTEMYISDKDAMAVIPDLPRIYSEPFSDSSQIPTYMVSRLARQHVTVSLSGDGGDELFSGYTRYTMAERYWHKLARVPATLRAAAASVATYPSPRAYDRLATMIAPTRYHSARFGDKIHKASSVLALANIDQVYRRLCSHWEAPCDVVLDSHEPPTVLTGLKSVPAGLSGVKRMMYLDLLSYLPDDILTKVDRAAMAVSLETRVPMLDHRVVEFAMSLPLSISRRENISKWPLKTLLYRFIPKGIVDRPKMGFGIPIDTWLRGGLRDWAENLLDPKRLGEEGFFNVQMIRAVWEAHLSGHQNNQYLLWDVLMFESWKEHNLSRAGGRAMPSAGYKS